MKTLGIYTAIFMWIFTLSGKAAVDSAKHIEKNPDTVMDLIGKLQDPSPPEVCRAIFYLRKHRDYRAVPPLINMLGHPHETVTNTAALALLDLQDLGVVEELLKALKSPLVTLRAKAALVLGKTGDYRAIAPLTLLREDKSREIREAVRQALEMLNPVNIGDQHPTTIIPQGLKLVVGDNSNLAIYRFQGKEDSENKGIFTVDASISLEFPRHLRLDNEKKQIIAVTPQQVAVLDYRLKLLEKKSLMEAGAAALYQDYLLVSDNGYLKALHLRRNLEEIDQVPLVQTESLSSRRKNAHDIIVYHDTAFVLDNIMKPVYVLMVNLGELDRGRLETIKTISLAPTPANSTPHLDGQWLFPVENTWALVISASSFVNMGDQGGPSHGLCFLPIAGLQEKDFFFGQHWRHSSRYDYILYPPVEYEVLRRPNGDYCLRIPRSIDKENGFWIRAVTPMAPPWALIERNHSYFLVRITLERIKGYTREYYEPAYHVFISRNRRICKMVECPWGIRYYSIQRQGSLIFISIGKRLVVVDTKQAVMPIFQQNFPQPIRDFLIL
jgi:hypothetical protein